MKQEQTYQKNPQELGEKKSFFLLEISHIMWRKIFPVNFRIYLDYGTLCQTFSSIIAVTSWISP
ncbi:MAG: hypothetical protein K0S36_449 [Nitrosospira multiformis]|nr:hypothetical protein [Nitrosospira multiformis]